MKNIEEKDSGYRMRGSKWILSRWFTDGKKDGKTAPPYKSHTVIWLNNPD